MAIKSNCGAEKAFLPLLVGTYCLLGLVGMSRHEMWADELHAWLLASESSSLGDLTVNWSGHGHPLLWNLCIYFLTRITTDPRSMQLLHLLIAVGSVYVFAKYSPFSKLIKALFAFGYFPLFEYALISRAYALGVFCVFVFCTLFSRRSGRYIIISLVLSTMANTSVFGAILAIAFALTLAADAFLYKETRASLRKRKFDAVGGAAMFAVGLGCAVFFMVPPAGEGFPAPWRTDLSLLKVGKVLTTVWNSYLPLPDLFTVHFWNTSVFDRLYPSYLNIVGPVHALLSLALLAAAAVYFVRTPVVLFCFVCGTAGIFLFLYSKYFGFMRHHGHLLILLVSCMWLSRYYPAIDVPTKALAWLSKVIASQGRRVAAVFLCVHMAVGMYALGMDIVHPFSAGERVALYIKDNKLDETPAACYPDWLCASFAQLLGIKFYYPNADRYGSFLVYDSRRRHGVECPDLLDRIRGFMGETIKEMVLISAEEIRCSHPELDVAPMTRLENRTIFGGDRAYSFYRVSRR
jgi:hypothetical protein